MKANRSASQQPAYAPANAVIDNVIGDHLSASSGNHLLYLHTLNGDDIPVTAQMISDTLTHLLQQSPNKQVA